MNVSRAIDNRIYLAVRERLALPISQFGKLVECIISINGFRPNWLKANDWATAVGQYQRFATRHIANYLLSLLPKIEH